MLYELFVTKNKLLDKHEGMHNALYTLTGNSMAFSKSDENWREKRRVLSTVFYKDKVMNIMKSVTSESKISLNDWKENYSDKGAQVNLPSIVSKLMARNIMVTIFGEDVTDRSI